MRCRIGDFCLRACCLLPSSLCRTRSLLPLFYLLLLFSAREYVLYALRALFVLPFVPGDPHPQRELLQLHVIFKHGHRAPFRLYKTDPNPKELWPEGLGMLTQIGRLQMYLVGMQLRQRYRDFLTQDPNEVYMQSSDAMRSMYSAYSFLAGLYPPEEEWAFTTELAWQPIEVHYVPEEQERYLQSNPNCPKYERSKKATANSDEVQAFILQHKSYYDFWNRHTGKPIHNYDNAGDLYKTLSVEADNNYTIPDWAMQHWNELVHQTDVGYYYHFKTQLQQRLRAGPILGLMLNRMKAKMDGEKSNIKVYAYSGHGSNTAAIQCALQAYDMKHAPHAATIVQELYAERNGSFSTRFLFFNSTHPEILMEPPFAIRLHACPSQFCPIPDYQDFIQHIIPKDWEKECRDNEEFLEETTPLQYPEYISAESSVSRNQASIFSLLGTFLFWLLHNKKQW